MPAVHLPSGPGDKKVFHTIESEGGLGARPRRYMDLARWMPRAGDGAVKSSDLGHVLENKGDKQVRRGSAGILGEGCRDKLGSCRHWQWRMLRLLARPCAAGWYLVASAVEQLACCGQELQATLCPRSSGQWSPLTQALKRERLRGEALLGSVCRLQAHVHKRADTPGRQCDDGRIGVWPTEQVPWLEERGPNDALNLGGGSHEARLRRWQG
mmetsp:Transcript_109723/g.283567  ORF Transcript_109723/g.283567 Transcript_109723/m.283567 type:complete len:212 (+) Transcript_109723:435-1070(+)